MKNACPNCKNNLVAEHSFCPYCGFDLRTSKANNLGRIQEETTSEKSLNSLVESNVKKADYRTPFIVVAMFMVISIFIWSYVYTNWKFNFDVFLNRLINHFAWLLLVPYLISLGFKKAKSKDLHYYCNTCCNSWNYFSVLRLFTVQA